MSFNFKDYIRSLMNESIDNKKILYEESASGGDSSNPVHDFLIKNSITSSELHSDFKLYSSHEPDAEVNFPRKFYGTNATGDIYEYHVQDLDGVKVIFKIPKLKNKTYIMNSMKIQSNDTENVKALKSALQFVYPNKNNRFSLESSWDSNDSNQSAPVFVNNLNKKYELVSFVGNPEARIFKHATYLMKDLDSNMYIVAKSNPIFNDNLGMAIKAEIDKSKPKENAEEIDNNNFRQSGSGDDMLGTDTQAAKVDADITFMVSAETTPSNYGFQLIEFLDEGTSVDNFLKEFIPFVDNGKYYIYFADIQNKDEEKIPVYRINLDDHDSEEDAIINCIKSSDENQELTYENLAKSLRNKDNNAVFRGKISRNSIESNLSQFRNQMYDLIIEAEPNAAFKKGNDSLKSFGEMLYRVVPAEKYTEEIIDAFMQNRYENLIYTEGFDDFVITRNDITTNPGPDETDVDGDSIFARFDKNGKLQIINYLFLIDRKEKKIEIMKSYETKNNIDQEDFIKKIEEAAKDYPGMNYKNLIKKPVASKAKSKSTTTPQAKKKAVSNNPDQKFKGEVKKTLGEVNYYFKGDDDITKNNLRIRIPEYNQSKVYKVTLQGMIDLVITGANETDGGMLLKFKEPDGIVKKAALNNKVEKEKSKEKPKLTYSDGIYEMFISDQILNSINERIARQSYVLPEKDELQIREGSEKEEVKITFTEVK